MCFVYLGSLDNIKSVGTNKLIQEFAKLVMSPEDITKNYKFLHKKRNRKKSNKCEHHKEQVITNCIQDEYKNIYNIIGTNLLEINDIVKLSNESMQDVMSKLTLLELEGKVEKVAGNRYRRC